MSYTIGSNLQTAAERRVTTPIYLVKVTLPASTLYYTTWSANVTYDSNDYVPMAIWPQINPSEPNKSPSGTLRLSINNATLNFLALDGLEEATFQLMETQGGITISTNDVLEYKELKVKDVNGRNGWAEIELFDPIEQQYLPNEYIVQSVWGPHIRKPGTVVLGPKTFYLKREQFG